MARIMASPPHNTVTSFQVMFTASLARAAHTNDGLKGRASRRSTTLERSRDCNSGISTSNMSVLVFKGRSTPADLFQYFFAVAITSRKHLRLTSGVPLPPTTSGPFVAHERRHCDKWGMGVKRMGGKLGRGGVGVWGGFGLLHTHVSSKMKKVTKISHRQTYCRTFLLAPVGVRDMRR